MQTIVEDYQVLTAPGFVQGWQTEVRCLRTGKLLKSSKTYESSGDGAHARAVRWAARRALMDRTSD